MSSKNQKPRLNFSAIEIIVFTAAALAATGGFFAAGITLVKVAFYS